MITSLASAATGQSSSSGHSISSCTVCPNSSSGVSPKKGTQPMRNS